MQIDSLSLEGALLKTQEYVQMTHLFFYAVLPPFPEGNGIFLFKYVQRRSPVAFLVLFCFSELICSRFVGILNSIMESRSSVNKYFGMKSSVQHMSC